MMLLKVLYSICRQIWKTQWWLTDFIKGLFDIHSPSRLFHDEIGANLALGIGEGFSDEMRAVEDDMKNALPTAFDIKPAVNTGNISGYTGGVEVNALAAAIKQALQGVAVVLDDNAVGEFVTDTVTNAIYY